ncbi:MAG: MauE/DoxX family redox-associated membrane protein [Ilumatobacteraceae bacterium]
MSSDFIAWTCSALVGAVFVFAGVSKLTIGKQWPIQATNLGAPHILIPFIPWVEIVVGVGLIGRILSAVANIAALVLLLSFTALIVEQLRRGLRPPCACFGGRSRRPIGWSNVTRNMVLVALVLVATFA